MRVLVRPEQVEISAGSARARGAPARPGTIVERSFLGALRRVRVRMPPIPGTRQAAPAVYGEEGLLIDAVLPAEADLGGPEVWVSLRGWHILAPPRPRLLVCDLPAQGSPAPFPLVRGPRRAAQRQGLPARGVPGARTASSRCAPADRAQPWPGPPRRRGGGAARAIRPRRSPPSSGRASTTSPSFRFPAEGRVETLMGLLETCRRRSWCRKGSRRPSGASSSAPPWASRARRTCGWAAGSRAGWAPR